MPEIVADLPSPSCYHLFFGARIKKLEPLSPDPSPSRAREGPAKEGSGNLVGCPPGSESHYPGQLAASSHSRNAPPAVERRNRVAAAGDAEQLPGAGELTLKRRGLVIGPELAIADGALGFWQGIEEVRPKTRGQRCWVHKTANLLNRLPKNQQWKANALCRTS